MDTADACKPVNVKGATVLFVVLGILFLSWAYFKKLNPPPSREEIFSSQAKVVLIEGLASVYVAPRGQPSIVIMSPGKWAVYMDCMVRPSMCSGLSGTGATRISAKGVRISNQFFWPISAEFSSGPPLDQKNSGDLYELYLERSQGIIGFLVRAGAGFLGLAALLAVRARSK